MLAPREGQTVNASEAVREAQVSLTADRAGAVAVRPADDLHEASACDKPAVAAGDLQLPGACDLAVRVNVHPGVRERAQRVGKLDQLPGEFLPSDGRRHRPSEATLRGIERKAPPVPVSAVEKGMEEFMNQYGQDGDGLIDLRGDENFIYPVSGRGADKALPDGLLASPGALGPAHSDAHGRMGEPRARGVRHDDAVENDGGGFGQPCFASVD